jgi:hypothetical protein
MPEDLHAATDLPRCTTDRSASMRSLLEQAVEICQQPGNVTLV